MPASTAPSSTPRPARLAAALALLAGALLVAVNLTLSPGTAYAGTYQQWRFRTGEVCVVTHGWRMWPAVEAAARWDAAANLTVVASPDCAGYPVSQRIVIRTYNDPADKACSKTVPGPLWSPAQTGKSYSTISTMSVWFNMADVLFGQCHRTAAMRAHLVSHELGHALGLGHPDPVAGRPQASVMASWAYQWPTSLDLSWVAARYAS